MSWKTYTVTELTCNHPDCENSYKVLGGLVSASRDRAAMDGWTWTPAGHGKEGIQDFCPLHDQEKTKPSGFDFRYLSGEKCEYEERQPQPDDDGSCGENAIALCWWDDEQKDNMKVCGKHLNYIRKAEEKK